MQAVLRPYFRQKSLLSQTEQRFYKVLRSIGSNYAIQAKVRLVDLIGADDRHRFWQANFRRVCSKHIDFVICDLKLSPIIAVELDDSSHEREDRRRRDNDIDRLFAAVAFPLLRVQVQNDYDTEDLTRRLLEKLGTQ